MESRCIAVVIVLLSLLSTVAQAKDCTGSVNITISGQYTWTQGNETAEAQYPLGAHFSPMICAVSNTAELFAVGSTASEGFRIIAEDGVETDLQRELETSENVKQVERRNDTIPGSIGEFSVTLEVSSNYSHVACVAMIAPSPDWVVGWTDTDICNSTTGEFITEEARLLRAYDAGTDSGKTYTAANEETDPRGVIERVGEDEDVIDNYGFINLRRSTSSDIDSDNISGDESNNSSSEESKDDSECFSGDVNVELKDGGLVKMSKLQVGDRVKVGHGEYSTVFMFTHKLPNAVSEFVKISLNSERSLTLTKGHYLYVDGALKAAQAVTTGDYLELGDGRVDAVDSVELVSSKGLYNPQTLQGDIVVNDIRASTYTSAIRPSLAHALLSPLRAMHHMGLSDPSAGVFEKGASYFAKMLPPGHKVEL
eukprot:Plantae.Rhodophyta-Hildenbrandia_rubra.ctg5039.p1 GENE.Plantae.Rhodophyta-Hildenbrandia_rubra.ctg5039~~Plantae.Rhodophyta-Hildenbrandia_rubra.ctg5039.p1  ORF type:complete len:425 (+),score=59.31 Plantae.Rhodophyta-Hildenbrandia_rubra.ctg5039:145-1419(+)